MKYIALLGRILFTIHFLISVPLHFTSAGIGYAEMNGVPMASVLVPFSGIMALIGGLSILLGYKAKIGAWILVAFLLPVNLMMHQFWAAADPMQSQMQMILFFKDLSMTGAALIIAYFGEGELSLDAKLAKR